MAAEFGSVTVTRLAGKRIAVIGAGSVGEGMGNGRAAAIRFAQEGAQVLCVDRDADAGQATTQMIIDDGGRATPLALDVTNRCAGETLVAAMNDHFDGIDVLHFNVGISKTGGIADISDADWEQIFEINLTSAMRLTRAVVPMMRGAGKGALTYVSSLAAVMSGPYAYTSYEVSKAALCRLSRSVARENAEYNIRSNVILPGMIDTPHVAHFVAGGVDPATLAASRSAAVPLGRQGSAMDVANAAVFLASDEAGYITGAELRVDGGLSL